MLPPPPKGSTSQVRNITFLDWQEYTKYEGDVLFRGEYPRAFPHNQVTKNPNPSSPPPKPKGVWLPCKDYRRSGAQYKPYGHVYGEDMGGLPGKLLRQCWHSSPFGNQNVNDSVFRGNGAINAPYDNLGQHPFMDLNTRNRLITETLLKVQSRKANYGEALAESRKTVNHLADTVSRVANLLIGIRRRDTKRIRKALGVGKRKRISASASWLEYQYAWLPLMGDVYDTYGLITRGFGTRPQLIRAVRNISDRVEVNLTVSGMRATGAVSIQDRCILFYKIRDADLAKYGQMGLINPLEVLWALTPYSFVIDWFVPVGNFLQALTATVGTTFVDGCVSRSTKGSRTLEAITAGTRYTYVKDKSDWGCVSSHQSFQRSRISSPPVPSLYMKNPFSTSHVTSALALLAQLSRR